MRAVDVLAGDRFAVFDLRRVRRGDCGVVGRAVEIDVARGMHDFGFDDDAAFVEVNEDVDDPRLVIDRHVRRVLRLDDAENARPRVGHGACGRRR